jgi:hypothetical protein
VLREGVGNLSDRGVATYSGIDIGASVYQDFGEKDRVACEHCDDEVANLEMFGLFRLKLYVARREHPVGRTEDDLALLA